MQAQIEIAHACLQRKGTFLLKMFHWFDENGAYATILSVPQHFDSVRVVKPPHSMITNDERYVLFQNYDPLLLFSGASNATVETDVEIVALAQRRRNYASLILMLAEIDILLREYFPFQRIGAYLVCRRRRNQETR